MTKKGKATSRKAGQEDPFEIKGRGPKVTGAAARATCKDAEAHKGASVSYDPGLWKSCPLCGWRDKAFHEHDLLEKAKEALEAARARMKKIRQREFAERRNL